MKRIFRSISTAVMMALLCAFQAAALDFTSADALLSTDYAACKKELKTMLDKTQAPSDKAQVLWRLARLQVLMGMNESTKEAKRAVFAEGVDYAAKAVEADPKNADCHMWHCAAVGREIQTHPLMEQASAVPMMMEDLSTILEKLGRTGCSEAWHALAEIYWNHPFKSNDDAANFARQAARTIPAGEPRIGTCNLLAKILYDRDWSAEKRASVASKNASKAARASAAIEKHSYLDGILGAGWKCPWGGGAYGSISDRQEAAALLSYAAARYKAAKVLSKMDKDDYKELVSLQSKYNN